jgi:hypothetical protein
MIDLFKYITDEKQNSLIMSPLRMKGDILFKSDLFFCSFSAKLVWTITFLSFQIGPKDKNVMARTRKYYLKNNYLTLRSKSHEGHYGMRHTALWSCTHIPNIIDLSGKTKKLWSRQASLRRSRRTNQT